jgi:hypothetical protein
MHFVINGVEPSYAFLHFVDWHKVPNLSDVLLRFSMVRSEYESLMQGYPRDLDRYMNVINQRMGDIANETYANAGNTSLPFCTSIFISRDVVYDLLYSCVVVALHPRTHYSYDTTTSMMNDL